MRGPRLAGPTTAGVPKRPAAVLPSIMVMSGITRTRRWLPAFGAGLSLHRRPAGTLTGLVTPPLPAAALAHLRHVVDLPGQTGLYPLAVVVPAPVLLLGHGVIPARWSG
jgi:hypothetical protein